MFNVFILFSSVLVPRI